VDGRHLLIVKHFSLQIETPGLVLAVVVEYVNSRFFRRLSTARGHLAGSF
jgi:hypothetical protein